MGGARTREGTERATAARGEGFSTFLVLSTGLLVVAGIGSGAAGATACDPADGTGYVQATVMNTSGELVDEALLAYRFVDLSVNETVLNGTTSNGEFVAAVPTGRYLIRIIPIELGGTGYGGTGYGDGSTTVCVRPNETVVVQVTLKPATSPTATGSAETVANATTPTESVVNATEVSSPSTPTGTTAAAHARDGGTRPMLMVVVAGLLVVGLGSGVWRLRTGGDGEGSGDSIQSDGERSMGDTAESDDGAVTCRTSGVTDGSPDGSEPGGDRSSVQSPAGTGPPEQVPRAPDVDVDYGALVEEDPIGGGGNADVVRARLPTDEDDAVLAVKRPRLSGTLHADAVDRLLDEAETWAKLDDHDHVVGVVDYGAEPLPWIAMEYMDTGHLGERAGQMDLPQALWTAIAVTKGVRHAHRRGVAHLDLKPANVLFRGVEGAWDVPKVADWGLSKHLLDHSGSVEGLSPQYAAPEQFDDDIGPADDITDVYQLGALFYELVTGRPPFEGSATQVMRAVLDEQPTPPSEVADVPPGLDDVLLTALATEKADRYESVLLLRNDLQQLYDDE